MLTGSVSVYQEKHFSSVTPPPPPALINNERSLIEHCWIISWLHAQWFFAHGMTSSF